MGDYSKIIVDVAICGTTNLPKPDVAKFAAKNYLEAINIRNYYKNTSSVWEQAKAYPGIDMRYYFQLETDCPGAGGIDFSNSTTWCLQEQGRSDAKAMLELGSETIAEKFDNWNRDRVIAKKYPHFSEYLTAVYNDLFSQ